MVTCSKCGSENPDDAMFCSSCGVHIDQSGAEAGHESYGRRREPVFFGLPSGAIPAVALGAIIIIIGLTYSSGHDFGEVIGGWGEDFGRSMGGWGEDFGRSAGEWGEGIGRYFEGFGEYLGRGVGPSVAIILGLLIIGYAVSVQSRR